MKQRNGWWGHLWGRVPDISHENKDARETVIFWVYDLGKKNPDSVRYSPFLVIKMPNMSPNPPSIFGVTSLLVFYGLLLSICSGC